MEDQDKTKEDLAKELQELRQERDALKTSYEKIRLKFSLDESMILKLLMAVNTTSEAIFLTDTEGIITYVNSGFTALYGYTADEVIGKVTTRIIKSGLLEKEVYENFWKTLLNKTEVKGEILNKRKNGELVLVEGTANPILDEQNEIIGFIGIQRDITEQKKKQESLRESEQKFNEIITNLDEAYYRCTLDGLLLEHNPAFKKIFGFDTNQDMEGVNIPDFWINPKQRLIYLDMIMNNGFAKNYLVDIKTRSGKKSIVMVNSHLVKDENGEVVGIEGTFADVTEQKLAEEEIKRRNEELHLVNAEKDKFYSIIAHDLRSPFTSFLGLTQIMAEDLPTMTQDQIHKSALMMRKSATNLYSLLENLLEWSQMQQGVATVEPEPLLIIPKISGSLVLYLDAFKNKKIDISYDIPEDLTVFADGNMFESIIRNLVFNAIKFTPQEGRIAITAKSSDNNWVEISVKDSGIGMNQEMVANLFQVDTNTSRKGTNNEPSTGFGLIICKDFIEKHGGKIWVESEEGKGSTFYFTIPYNAELEAKTVINDVPSGIGVDNRVKKLKVIIAEDDETSTVYLTRVVNKYCKEVFYAVTGVEAVEICRNNPDIDLILMDINMPEMDGYEATRQIREFNKDVVIIAQTAYGLSGDREKAIDAGCNDYISKPIDSTLLKALIRKHFKK